MAEKSTRVPDGSEGEYIATRDGVENDEGANARVVQLTDEAFRALTIDITSDTPEREFLDINGLGDVADLADLAGQSSKFNNSGLIIGDKTKLVACMRWTISSIGNPSIYVTPIIYDDDDIPIGSLQTRKIQTVCPEATVMNEPLHYNDALINYMLAPMMSWHIEGGYKVRLHITFDATDWGGAGNDTNQIKVWAEMVSGPPQAPNWWSEDGGVWGGNDPVASSSGGSGSSGGGGGG